MKVCRWDIKIYKKIFFAIVVSHLLLPVAVYATSQGRSTAEIAPDEKLFFSHSPITKTESGVAFDVDKRADIVIYLSDISSLTFDYKSEGDFLMTYSSIVEIKPQELLDPFTVKVKLLKGDGQVTLDLRGTRSWSQESSPIITLEGTGLFNIKRLTVEKVEDAKDYISEKNRAFFWISEIPRYTTINFLTPMYWDISRKLYIAGLLGAFVVIITVALWVVRLFSENRKKVETYFVYISLFLSFAFAAHFMVRFIPNMNWGFYLENGEKIRRYYFNPELGELASATRKYIGVGNKVAVLTDHKDQFGRDALCFNIAPADCVYYEPQKSELIGARGQSPLPASEIDTIVSYSSTFPPPEGFEKIYELNRNVYIASKK